MSIQNAFESIMEHEGSAPVVAMNELRALGRFVVRSSARAAVALVGFTVLAAGFVMLVTPGPGLVVIIAGLAILSTQFAWAERALNQARRRAETARAAAMRKAPRRRQRPPGSAA